MARKSKVLALRYFPEDNDLAVAYFDMAGPQIYGPERIKALNHIVRFFLKNAPEDDPYRSCFDKRRDSLLGMTEELAAEPVPAPAEKKRPPKDKGLVPAEDAGSGLPAVAGEKEEEEGDGGLMQGIYDSLGMGPGGGF